MFKFRLDRLKWILERISDLDFWISSNGKHSQKKILVNLRYLKKALGK